jgi:hypothetical protein
VPGGRLLRPEPLAFSIMGSVPVPTSAPKSSKAPSEPEKTDTPPALQAPGISGDPEPPSRKRRGRPPKAQHAQALLHEQLTDGPRPGALVDAADNWLNVRRIELTVHVDNEPGIRLYKKFCFEAEGTHRGGSHPGAR